VTKAGGGLGLRLGEDMKKGLLYLMQPFLYSE